MRSRVVITLIATVIALALPSGMWSPPPEAIRLGPMYYDSQLSAPRIVAVPGGSLTQPSDLTLSLEFSILERPKEYAYIFSSSPGTGKGIKISVDLYGNIYLSLEHSSNQNDVYQLVKLSDPTAIGALHTLEVRVGLTTGLLTIKFDGREVPPVEPRPLHFFDFNQVTLSVTRVEVGGSDNHSLIGEVSNATLVYGQSNPPVDLINVRILLVLLVLGIWIPVLATLADRSKGESTDIK